MMKVLMHKETGEIVVGIQMAPIEVDFPLNTVDPVSDCSIVLLDDHQKYWGIKTHEDGAFVLVDDHLVQDSPLEEICEL